MNDEHTNAPVAALASLRDGHRVVDDLVLPPPPADPELRPRKRIGADRALAVLIAIGVACTATALVPGIPTIPLIVVALLLGAPAALARETRARRFAKLRSAATQLLEAGDPDAAEMRLRALARTHGGEARGALALLDVARCKAQRGDLRGALEIYGELYAARAFTGKAHQEHALALALEAADVCDRIGDTTMAARWRKVAERLK